MKQCSGCKKEKPLDEFSKDKSKKDGLRTQCKECSKQNQKQYRKINKEKLNEYHRQYRSNGGRHADKPYVYFAYHNGNYYIGSTKYRWTERFSKHKHSAATGLGHYINEHNLSKEDFEVKRFSFETIEEARDAEKSYLCECVGQKGCLNKNK